MHARLRLKLLSAGLAAAIFVALVPWAYSYGLRRAEDGGKDLSLRSWRACYEERGETPPPGPREGVWLGDIAIRTDPVTGIRMKEHASKEHNVDARGMQHVRGTGKRVLVLGASVAAGTYASRESTTWFALLARARNFDMTVLATPMWTASQEALALEQHFDEVRPDMVMTLDGLNDLLMIGVSNEQSAEAYIATIERMHAFVAGRAEFVCVLQPSLAEREPPSELETHLLPVASKQRDYCRRSYARMRAALDRSGIRWIDASRALNSEPGTVFTDAWHFADRGHLLLADFLAPRLP